MQGLPQRELLFGRKVHWGGQQTPSHALLSIQRWLNHAGQQNDTQGGLW